MAKSYRDMANNYQKKIGIAKTVPNFFAVAKTVLNFFTMAKSLEI